MLTAQELLDHFWDGKLPVQVQHLAKAISIEVVAGADIEDVGLISVESNKVVAKIKYTVPSTQYRFILAHQIGHYLLGHLHATDKQHREKLSNFKTGVECKQEKKANDFAIDLLIPKATLKYAIGYKGYCSIADLAILFGVSEVVMRQRLLDLQIISA